MHQIADTLFGEKNYKKSIIIIGKQYDSSQHNR